MIKIQRNETLYYPGIKLQVMSGSKFDLPEPIHDILVIAGIKSISETEIADVIEHTSKQWKHVLYVPGICEYSDTDKSMYIVDKLISGVVGNYRNVHLLKNNTVKLDGQRYIGVIAWPEASTVDISDFKDVKYGRVSDKMPLSLRKLNEWYKEDKDFLNKCLQDNDILISYFPTSTGVGIRTINKYSDSIVNIPELSITRPVPVNRYIGKNIAVKAVIIDDKEIDLYNLTLSDLSGSKSKFKFKLKICTPHHHYPHINTTVKEGPVSVAECSYHVIHTICVSEATYEVWTIVNINVIDDIYVITKLKLCDNIAYGP